MSEIDGSDNNQRPDGAPPVPGLDTFGEDARQFRKLLASKNVNVADGSEMDVALRTMEQASEYVRHPPSAPGIEARATQALETEPGRTKLERFLLRAVAGANLVRTVHKALAVSPTVFDQSWDLFRGPDVFVAKSGKRRRERDLTWELFVAALCVHAANDVKIGKPDVRCRIRDVAWGVECKVFNSPNPAKHVERVKEAVRQLQDADIDRGFVAVNLTNVVDHSRLGKSIRAFGKNLFTQDEITKDLGHRVNAIAAPFNDVRFREWLRPYHKTRALFFHANTICLVGKSLSLSTFRVWIDVGNTDVTKSGRLGRQNPLDEAMANRFERAAHGL